MGWSGRGKLGVCDKTALPDGCNTARRKLFTHRPICKWSVCDEALRTRTSPGRSIPVNGIQWIKLLHPFSAESLYLSILPHSSGVNRPRSVPICVSPSSPLPPTPPSSFPSFLPLLLSKIENRTAGNWRSLSLLRPSGFTMLLTAAHLQHTIFRFSFCLLFPLPSSSTSSSLSSTINSTSPFWNWIFIRDGPGVPVVFMPPSSHQFSFLLSSLHFSPFSPLSPPVNYLLSVRLGQKLHFPPDGYKKSRKNHCSLECAAVQQVEREAEKIMIKQTMFLFLCRQLWTEGTRCSVRTKIKTFYAIRSCLIMLICFPSWIISCTVLKTI